MLRLHVGTLLAASLVVSALIIFAHSSSIWAQTPDVEEANVLVVNKKTTPAPWARDVVTMSNGSAARAEALRDAVESNSRSSGNASSETQLYKAEPVSRPQNAQQKSASANSRFISLDIPLKVQAFYLGDVNVRMAPNGEAQVRIGSLTEPLKKIMKPEAIRHILSIGETTVEKSAPVSSDAAASQTPPRTRPGVYATFIDLLANPSAIRLEEGGGSMEMARNERQSGEGDAFLPLAKFKERGLDIRYDPLASELIVAPSPEQRLDGNLSLGRQTEVPASANSQKPAFFSAYLNTRMSVDYVTQSTLERRGLTAPSFDFDGAMRIGSLVFENEGVLTPQLNMAGANGPAYDFTRRGSRLIFDAPQDVIRYKAGDLSPDAASFQSSPDLLGVSAERSYSRLRPGQNIRPAGQHTFRIDRPSNVDILVDGAMARKVHLQPGNYNLNDLPLKPGATKITLIIEEDTGGRRELEFTNFAGQELLAPGIDEWQIAAGIEAAQFGNAESHAPNYAMVNYLEPDYLWNEPIVTGFYRTGVTPSVTVGGNAQASSRALMAGGEVSADISYGYISIDMGGSFQDKSGAGFAVRSTYELANIQDEAGRSQSFRFSAEYQSAAFTTVNAYSAPEDYGVNFAALYSKDLTENISASLSGAIFLSRNELPGINKWGADLTVSKRFSNTLSGALSVGYGQDDHAVRTVCACVDESDSQGARAFARISYRPGANSSLLFSEDAQTRTSRATYSQSEGSTAGPWNVLVDATQEGATHSADIGGSLGYSGNRGEVALSHASRLEGLTATMADPHSTDERTSLRVESAIATADGAWSFGKPIRNSFAIVETHETLADRDLALGPKDKEIGHNDWFAPALVTDINPYIQRRVEYDVDNLPLGYDLGAGAFDFFGPYKSGYRVQAGSAYTVTAAGTLLNEDARPVSLLSGTAREANGKEGTRVQLFTNRAGKFGAQGLAPGIWVIEMAAEPEPVRFRLEIPTGITGLYQAGSLKPLRTGEKLDITFVEENK